MTVLEPGLRSTVGMRSKDRRQESLSSALGSEAIDGHTKRGMTFMSNHAADSPSPETSSPLLSLPMLDQVLPSNHRLPWQMNPAEQAMMIYLLEQIRPRVAIE